LAQAGDQQGLDEAFRQGTGLAGDNAVKMGRWWDQAVTALTRALELKRDSHELRLARGRAFARLGQTRQAEDDFTEAVKMAEKDLLSGHRQRELAFALQREPGQLPRAEAVLRAAVKTFEQIVMEQPRDLEGLHFVADTHRRLALVLDSRGQRDAALVEYREAIRLHVEHLARVPGSTYGADERAAAYFEYARLLSHVGRATEARTHLEKALAIRPTSEFAYNDIAWLLATAPDPTWRDPARAVEMARKAVEIDPSQGTFWKSLGTALYRAEDWSGAIEGLRKSNELGAKATLGFNGYFLAMAHHRRGESGLARIWFDVAGRWHRRSAPANEELKLFRAEAAGLLGLGAEADRGDGEEPADDSTPGRLVLQADPTAGWARALLGKMDPRRHPAAATAHVAPMPNGPQAFAR
jgi:tetratricopeptide (TPR) repeat protein